MLWRHIILNFTKEEFHLCLFTVRWLTWINLVSLIISEEIVARTYFGTVSGQLWTILPNK